MRGHGPLPRLRGAVRGVVRGGLETLDVIVARDPSVGRRSEALLHPTALVLAGHRVGNALYRSGCYRSARTVSMIAKVVTGGVEIHPGAQIGRRFFIDHGGGTVIGETAVIGDDVSLFHQVTLGSLGWWNDRRREPGERRHPRLGNGVTVGAAATLLGPITIGDDALIGATALVMTDVPKGGRALAPQAVLDHEMPTAPETYEQTYEMPTAAEGNGAQ
ncbi:serine acetyltransferase [Kitasatospora sp. MAP5-34]|uniref:serine O-acetyltransferase n=1 Tax=Kitasatospora sp. MAP5-34 TaxID=3035102 RepID=UPI002477118C|nr:serine acetyltransferase [Kitasatospora sp. MAP5-34]MDH6577348.1 serine O-acetyltransferase [Kitasatospora sp. MAP5-34]